MDFNKLLQQAVEAAKLVDDLRKTAQAMAGALSETEIKQLKAQLDQIHPVTMEMGADLDQALEKAKSTN